MSPTVSPMRAGPGLGPRDVGVAMSNWFTRLVRKRPASMPVGMPVAMPAPVTPPVHPVPMAARLAAWRDGAPLALAPMEVIHTLINQRRVQFCVNIADDPIQNAHRRGRFYEARELAMVSAHLKRGAIVLDVGANTGNHALWFALHAGAARVVVVEPNPLALEPLVGNVLGNRLHDVIDLTFLGIGLGEVDSAGWGMKKHDRNLGATKMFAGKGDLTVRRGDAVFGDLAPDLIKIDVEGMEMAVFSGLSDVIARARPLIMVEVLDIHAAAFADWTKAQGYRAEDLGKEPKLTNYLLHPLR